MAGNLFDTVSGNASIIAMDHGLAFGAPEGFKDPEETLETVLSADPDGLAVGHHFADHFSHLWGDDLKLVHAADVVTFSTVPGGDERQDLWTQAFDVDELLSRGPAGIKVILVFGREDREVFTRNIEAVADLAERLSETDVPLIVEPVMWGPRIPEDEQVRPDYVESACRMAWEFGAEVLKTPYTGDVESFSRIVDNAPVPVMILGGPSQGGTREVLEEIHGAIQAGARGVIMGRKLWQSEDSERTIAAANRIIHDGVSVDEALN